MRRKSILRSFALVLSAALLSNTAQANSITVVNPSFEILPPGGLPFGCGAACSYSADAIPGWSTTGGGQFQPGPPSTTAYFNYVPDGNTIAYSNGGLISQTVGTTAQPGVTYTLQVDLGFRKDLTDLGTISLVVGGNTILATGTASQLSGNWETYTAIYTATALDSGSPISIDLYSPGAQGDFDNVRLSDVSATPLPAALPLFGGGILGLFALIHRRTKKNTSALAPA
jgi:hypothetical protein